MDTLSMVLALYPEQFLKEYGDTPMPFTEENIAEVLHIIPAGKIFSKVLRYFTTCDPRRDRVKKVDRFLEFWGKCYWRLNLVFVFRWYCCHIYDPYPHRHTVLDIDNPEIFGKFPFLVEFYKDKSGIPWYIQMVINEKKEFRKERLQCASCPENEDIFIKYYYY